MQILSLFTVIKYKKKWTNYDRAKSDDVGRKIESVTFIICTRVVVKVRSELQGLCSRVKSLLTQG